MSVFSFVKRRWFIRLIGLLLIAAFIWFAGPFFAFADYRPLEPETARLIAIGLVLAVWAIWAVIKWVGAKRASNQLAGAVLRPAPKEKDQPSAEAAKLRDRFEEAVSTLTKGGGRTGRSLYDLPWYVFIGAPGSGKTTALINSGLKFPLEQRVGKGAVRGVGGTRNCDWWFTDEAVFLDTAGRYTTQDSDASSDSEGWKEFLALLTKYRKRRPVNGIVLTVSAQDLMTLSESGREANIEAARRRLVELSKELRIQLPVYVMVTKCDMVAGFAEYFDDLTQEGRAQVWGVTFPYEQTLDGSGPRVFPEEFDALMARLNTRVFGRLEAERGARRRATVFGFPQQMAALREPLIQFVTEAFSSTHFDRPILLRGVYLTSGTQDGTQIDRLLGAIGRRFGLAAEAVAPAAGRGKAFFVERLLKEVVIPESGLAGVNRRLELKKAAWQLGTYAAIAVIVAVALVAFSVSYARNRAYLNAVSADVAALRAVPEPGARSSIEGVLPRLAAVRAVSDSANRYRVNTPWSMRWWLYQGASVGDAARDAYVRELDTLLLPQLAARIRQRLDDFASDPDRLYAYLKAYIMLGEPEHLDPKYLQELADNEWDAGQAVPGQGAPVPAHVRSLLEYSNPLRRVPLDATAVARARNTLRPEVIPEILFGQLQRFYAADGRALRPDVKAVAIDKVIRRKSGRPLTDPMPALYTKEVFNEVTAPVALAKLTGEFGKEAWVWNPGSLSVATIPKLMAQVTDLYERNYINAWHEFLHDLAIVPFPTVERYREALGILGGPTSPLRGVLSLTAEHTSFVPPAEATPKPAPDQSLLGRAAGFGRSALDKITGGAGLSRVTPGTQIYERFQPIQALMAGAPAPIDPVLEQVRKLRDRLTLVGQQAGGQSPLTALTDQTLFELNRDLKTMSEGLPPPVNDLVAQIAQLVRRVLQEDAENQLDQEYRATIVAACRLRVDGHYPFGVEAAAMSLSEFGDVFGHGGLLDKFFKDKLDALVDSTQRPWRWRQESVQRSTVPLSRFEEAADIRQMFFPEGGKTPKVPFYVSLSDLDKSATRFWIEIDGQTFDVLPGTRSPRYTADWPASKQGVAQVYFEDTQGGAERAQAVTGPWAWFQLIELARTGGSDSGVLFFKTRYHTGRVTVEPMSSTANPLLVRSWQQFRCSS